MYIPVCNPLVRRLGAGGGQGRTVDYPLQIWEQGDNPVSVLNTRVVPEPLTPSQNARNMLYCSASSFALAATRSSGLVNDPILLILGDGQNRLEGL